MKLPYAYVFDQLAQRWHIDPERLEELDAETIERGLIFASFEAQAAGNLKGVNGGFPPLVWVPPGKRP